MIVLRKIEDELRLRISVWHGNKGVVHCVLHIFSKAEHENERGNTLKFLFISICP